MSWSTLPLQFSITLSELGLGFGEVKVISSSLLDINILLELALLTSIGKLTKNNKNKDVNHL